MCKVCTECGKHVEPQSIRPPDWKPPEFCVDWTIWGIFPQIALAIGVLTSNRKGGWVYKFENWTWCRCWLPLLGAIAGLPLLGIGGVGVHVGGLDVVPLLAALAGCHCWVPLLGMGGGWVYTLADWTWCRCWLPWVPLLGCHCWAPLWGQWLDAIARCHCRMLATNSSGVHVGCHCWAPLLGPIAWVPLLGAIAGCHCWCAIAGCHFGVPWLDAIAGAIAACHCEKPLREKIDQSVTPFSAALFLCIDNTQKLAGAIWGLCWYNFKNAVSWVGFQSVGINMLRVCPRPGCHEFPFAVSLGATRCGVTE